MKLHTLRRTGGIAAAAVVLSAGLAACSSDDSGSTATDTESSSSSTETETSSAPSEDTSESASTDDAAAQVFGEGCSAVPQSGAGSFNGMVTDPVATAASNNPLLSTLVTAVSQAGLVDTLNGLEAATVFAPTNDAFAALPKDTLDAVLADNALLTAILTHHVLPENDDPAAVVGDKTTVNGDTLTVEGDESGMTVSDGTAMANVICGNVPTANATVYVIDAVMTGATPPA